MLSHNRLLKGTHFWGYTIPGPDVINSSKSRMNFHFSDWYTALGWQPFGDSWGFSLAYAATVQLAGSVATYLPCETDIAASSAGFIRIPCASQQAPLLSETGGQRARSKGQQSTLSNYSLSFLVNNRTQNPTFSGAGSTIHFLYIGVSSGDPWSQVAACGSWFGIELLSTVTLLPGQMKDFDAYKLKSSEEVPSRSGRPRGSEKMTGPYIGVRHKH